MTVPVSWDSHALPVDPATSPIRKDRARAAERERALPLQEEADRQDAAKRADLGRRWDDGDAALDAELAPLFAGHEPCPARMTAALRQMGELIAEADRLCGVDPKQRRLFPPDTGETWNWRAGRVARLRAFADLQADLVHDPHGGRAALFAADLLVGAVDRREDLVKDVAHLLATRSDRAALGWLRHILDRLRNVWGVTADRNTSQHPRRPMRLPADGRWREVDFGHTAEEQVSQIVNGGDLSADSDLFCHLPDPARSEPEVEQPSDEVHEGGTAVGEVSGRPAFDVVSCPVLDSPPVLQAAPPDTAPATDGMPRANRKRIKRAEAERRILVHWNGLSDRAKDTATRDGIAAATGVSKGLTSELLRTLCIGAVGKRGKPTQLRTVPLGNSLLATLPAAEGMSEAVVNDVAECIREHGVEHLAEVARLIADQKADKAAAARRRAAGPGCRVAPS